jgi:hypothetical protein
VMPDVCGAWYGAGGRRPWLGRASAGTGSGPPVRGCNLLVLLRENQPILMIVNIEFFSES